MRELSEYFMALSEVTRLKIVQLLTEREMCVCELVDRLGISQPAVSHHLGVLRRAGLISDRKSGKWTYYSLDGNKIMENHDKFYKLALCVIEERITGGLPASPVQEGVNSYCLARGKFSGRTKIKGL